MDGNRRRFLGGALALTVTPLLGCATEPRSSSAPSPAPAPARPKPVAVDMHNHVYPPNTEPHPRHGPPTGGPPPPGGPRPEESAPSLDLGAELGRSGLTAVCSSFVLDFARNEAPGDARKNFLAWLDAIDAELAKGGLHRALTASDLRVAADTGRPTIVQTVEGAHFIEGDLARLEEVYARGLRHLQLLHDKDDLVSPLGDNNTGVAHLGGLTAFGADVVRACNRLGILVDLAHASHETVLGALKVATKPLVVSHTNLDTWTGSNVRMATMMRPRLISRDHARVVADAGGVVGVWTHLTDSLAEFVGSIKAMVDAIGVDHVGLGTDTDLLSPRAGKGTNAAWPGFAGAFFPAVSAEMRRQGFGEGDVEKVGGENYARVFAAATVKTSR